MKALRNFRYTRHITGLAIGLFSIYFGISILTNLHLLFIRHQARNVVTLRNETGSGGTGFIMKGRSGKRVIMTNYHVCNISATGYLEITYRGDTYITRILKTYKTNDLCAVEAPSTISDYMKTANYVLLGERVYSIGHPLLEPIAVTEGELSSPLFIEIMYGQNVEPEKCTGETFRLLETNEFYRAFGINNICVRDLEAQSSTVAILPGNSGSPVVNIYGHVVGVVFAAVESGVHSYVVPLHDLKSFLSDL